MVTTSSSSQKLDLNDAVLREADAAAVVEHLASGKPLDPVLQARVHARAEQVTESIRLDRGLVDDVTFQSLLDDE